jgi:hypothetical protein
MVRSERIQTFILIGIGFVLIFDCATVGPQLTNNKAHNVTRYDPAAYALTASPTR